MNQNWLSLRKDIFIRDLFKDFFDAKEYFEKINKNYKKSSYVPFKTMDAWVGTETNKGPLWNLKDQSHRLFRNNQYKSSLHEYLFDWTIGSIFHEAMKLKEDAYQIESYKPLLEMEVSNYNHDSELSIIIEEYFLLIEKANVNLGEELKSIAELFTKAVFQLREILPTYNDNILLIRYLLDMQKAISKILGKDNLKHILTMMFPVGLHEGYFKVAQDCTERGWYHEAQTYLKNALKNDFEKNLDQKVVQKMRKKIQSLITEEDQK